MNGTLLQQVKEHWQQLRGMTYDFLNELKEEDLNKKLPFSQSQDIKYQFNCMIGAQESNIPPITKGVWEGFASSLDNESQVTIEVIKNIWKKQTKNFLMLWRALICYRNLMTEPVP